MPTDRDALLAAILAHPDEDTPRLAFADLLDEEGETERAAFIREQIAGGSNINGRWIKAPRPFSAKWFPDLPQWALQVDPEGKGWLPTRNLGDHQGVARALVTRGFVGAVACRFAAYRGNAIAWFRSHPIQRVVITDKWPGTIDPDDFAPNDFAPHLRPPGTCVWTADDTPGHTLAMHSVLPRTWIDDMTRLSVGKTGRGFPARWFDTVDDAQAALSEHCVALGRQAALTGDPP